MTRDRIADPGSTRCEICDVRSWSDQLTDGLCQICLSENLEEVHG